MASHSQNHPKILFFPFMAPGHMLPTVDMARLFAARGADATIFTTPANAAIIRPSIAGSTVRLHVVPFPTFPGLPDGVENFPATASPEVRAKFGMAVLLLREPFDQSLQELAPDCTVTDVFLPWTADVAAERGVPRLVFHGSNFFSPCVIDSLDRYKPLVSLPAEAESIAIPGLPHGVKVLKSQIDHTPNPMMLELFNRVREAESKSYGTIVNSFYELEPDYVEHYRNVMGKKAWHVGPVSLCNVNVAAAEKSGRGNKAEIGYETCANWLDSKSPESIVYICFGSVADFSAVQVRELAMGLEASNRPFIWVVKKHNYEMLPEGFEERTKERGLIVRGWAPQILILNHNSVGCFVTHCGWNSSLECISAGLPMVTWPMFAEQFFNERLIVDVLKIGIAVGVKEYARGAEERGVIGAAAVENAVERVMGGEEEAEERRRRAKELREMARAAVEEGGSSYADMGNLMQELIDRKRAI